MDAAEREQLAMLTMLLSMCEQALSMFQAPGTRVDGVLVSDLERLVVVTRREIGVLSDAPELFS